MGRRPRRQAYWKTNPTSSNDYHNLSQANHRYLSQANYRYLNQSNHHHKRNPIHSHHNLHFGFYLNLIWILANYQLRRVPHLGSSSASHYFPILSYLGSSNAANRHNRGSFTNLAVLPRRRWKEGVNQIFLHVLDSCVYI